MRNRIERSFRPVPRRSMRCVVSASLVFVIAVTLGAHVRADIPPPDVEPCTGKAAGAACTYTTAGTCQNSTCSSPSPPPSGSSYACLRCMTGTTTGTQTDTGAGTGTPIATATNTQTETQTSKDSGSCSVGNASGAGRIAPWLLAAGFSLLFLFGRRRRRK